MVPGCKTHKSVPSTPEFLTLSLVHAEPPAFVSHSSGLPAPARFPKDVSAHGFLL